MATTQLVDVYNPLTFARRAQERQIELNRFLQSGVAVADALLANQISAGGNVGELPNFNALTMREPNYSTDDPAKVSTPDKISAGKVQFRTASRNNSWSVMDLARELALEDPVGAITNRIGNFWAVDDEQRIIRSCVGLYNSNVAANGADMVVDVSGAGAPTAANKISAEAVIDALQTMGDHKENISAIAMHSVVFTTLQKQQLIQSAYVGPDQARTQIFTYLGKRVIVDDSLPATNVGGSIKFITILFGGAAFGTASGRVVNPSEMQRKPEAGNGSGQEVIYSRVNNLFHPYGFSFTSNTVSGPDQLFATYSDLELAANWMRRSERKNVPIAFLITNG